MIRMVPLVCVDLLPTTGNALLTLLTWIWDRAPNNDVSWPLLMERRLPSHVSINITLLRQSWYVVSWPSLPENMTAHFGVVSSNMVSNCGFDSILATAKAGLWWVTTFDVAATGYTGMVTKKLPVQLNQWTGDAHDNRLFRHWCCALLSLDIDAGPPLLMLYADHHCWGRQYIIWRQGRPCTGAIASKKCRPRWRRHVDWWLGNDSGSGGVYGFPEQ